MLVTVRLVAALVAPGNSLVTMAAEGVPFSKLPGNTTGGFAEVTPEVIAPLVVPLYHVLVKFGEANLAPVLREKVVPWVRIKLAVTWPGTGGPRDSVELG